MAKTLGLDLLKEEVLLPEAYLVGLLYGDPQSYDEFTSEELNHKTFLNPVWGFFCSLGRHMYKNGVSIFDDITVYNFVKELDVETKYKDYGGYETVQEVMNEVLDKKDNLQAYFEKVKKYETIKKLCELFGVQVITVTDKYDYHSLNKEEIIEYWEDKLSQISMNNKLQFEEADLLYGLEDAIQEMDENPDIGLPFFESRHLTSISSGWADGCLYINGGYGGRGKTSFSFAKIVMSCITNNEKLLIVANEQSKLDFQKLLFVTAMGYVTKPKHGFNRKKLNEGAFTEEERSKLNEVVAWIKETTSEDTGLIKFVFLNSYTVENVKKVVKHYHRRGFNALMIDTGKPGDDIGGIARWQKFTEDFTDLYGLIRPNGGGLNIKTWVNVQLSDSTLTQRYLNELCFGDAKKIKNEASVVFMERPVFEDEYENGKRELHCYRWVPKEEVKEDMFGSKSPYKTIEKEYFKLEKYYEYEGENGHKKQRENIYYLLFTPKNRRGQDNTTGLDVLVMRVDFNSNTWKEIGYCIVPRDY